MFLFDCFPPSEISEILLFYGECMRDFLAHNRRVAVEVVVGDVQAGKNLIGKAGALAASLIM
jgi:hypothetical protein